MKEAKQLLVMVFVLSVVFFMIGLFILTAPEYHKILIKVFSEIVVLVVYGALIVFFVDRFVISLDEKKRNKFMRILAFTLPVFYKLAPILSNGILSVTKTLIPSL